MVIKKNAMNQPNIQHYLSKVRSSLKYQLGGTMHVISITIYINLTTSKSYINVFNIFHTKAGLDFPKR